MQPGNLKVEEIEEDFAKLTSWFRKIQQCDFFPLFPWFP